MRRSIPRTLLLAAAAVLAGACDNTTNDTGATTTTAPTTIVTESFAGSLNPNGGVTHTFTVAGAGTVTATLRDVAPDATIAIGLSMGTWNGVTCQIVLANDAALPGLTVTGNVSSSGILCARIYDVGKLTGTVTYTVDVIHP